MRLTEPLDISGLFWLPENADTQLHGLLKISDEADITLELAGVLANPFPSKDQTPHPTRIVGRLEKGGPITLDGCLFQKGNLRPGGLSNSTVLAELAFIGAELGSQEEAHFRELRFSVEGLDSWLDMSGIEFDQHPESYSGSIGYRVPEEIRLSILDGSELAFSFSISFPQISFPVTEATIRQKTFVSLQSRTSRPFEYFSSLAFKLCNFLSLALGETVAIQSMTGYSELRETNADPDRRPITIYGQFGPWSDTKPRLRRQTALFRYPEVASQIQEMVTNWIKTYDTVGPTLDLYFASNSATSMYLQTKVLCIAQALETLHRRTSEETPQSKEEFTELVESIVRSAPESARRWLKHKLRYANELTFQKRLERLVEPFERWFGDTEAKTLFIKRVRDTRNYLTHYDEGAKANIATDLEDLFRLYEKMSTLLQLHLLRLIGLNDEQIDKLVENNFRFRRRLGR